MAKATTTPPKTKIVTKLAVTAPGGPRRRAGYSFGPEATFFTREELGEKGKELVDAWRADPMLKIDEREFEEPDTDPDAPAAE